MENLKIKEIHEFQTHRNYKLRNWIQATFRTEAEKQAAWLTVNFIKSEYPQTIDILKGELIYEEKSEE